MYKFLLQLNNCVLAGQISAGAGLLDKLSATVCGSRCAKLVPPPPPHRIMCKVVHIPGGGGLEQEMSDRLRVAGAVQQTVLLVGHELKNDLLPESLQHCHA